MDHDDLSEPGSPEQGQDPAYVQPPEGSSPQSLSAESLEASEEDSVSPEKARALARRGRKRKAAAKANPAHSSAPAESAPLPKKQQDPAWEHFELGEKCNSHNRRVFCKACVEKKGKGAWAVIGNLEMMLRSLRKP